MSLNIPDRVVLRKFYLNSRITIPYREDLSHFSEKNCDEKINIKIKNNPIDIQKYPPAN